MGDRRQPRMEHFYRFMRKRTGILMQDGQPAGTVGIEFASVELAGAPTTVIVATGADGSLVVLAHPIDDCAAVTLVEG